MALKTLIWRKNLFPGFRACSGNPGNAGIPPNDPYFSVSSMRLLDETLVRPRIARHVERLSRGCLKTQI